VICLATGPHERAGTERLRQSELALEQARYEVTHARRQYDAVDPDNRLVAGELERRWNERLAAVARLEEQIQSLPSEQPRALRDDERATLLALADDLPQLWNHPAASSETRKRILRAVLKEIMVTVEADRLRLVLHWQGGDHTRLEVVKNRTGQNRWKTDVETVQLVRELARMLPDHSIAPVLNRLGIRSAKGYSWTQLRVRNFRSVHQIAVYRERERAERHELILYEAASRLGVSKMTVVRLIRDGLLPARQACVGAPYVIREDDLDRPAVRRALANGRAVSLDPRQEWLSFQRSRGTASCHHPVHAEEQAIIRMPRIIDAILIDDHRADQAAELEQGMPVAPVAGEPRGFDRDDCTDPTLANCRQQLLEAGTGDAGTGPAEIIIDHLDGGPAQGTGAIDEPVLAAPAFVIMQQLVAGRLANVNKGATGEVVRRDAGHRRSSRRRDPPIRLGAAGRRPPPPGGSAAIAPICSAGRAEAPPPAASRRKSLSDGVARSTLLAPLQGGGSPMHEAMSASTSARKSARRSTESRGWTTTACARRLASVIHAGSSASVRSGCRIMKCAMLA
jgi:excisionase family DNA binding protein